MISEIFLIDWNKEWKFWNFISVRLGGPLRDFHHSNMQKRSISDNEILKQTESNFLQIENSRRYVNFSFEFKHFFPFIPKRKRAVADGRFF